MQLTSILVSALAAASTATAASVAARQAQAVRRVPGCRKVSPSDLNFAVADLRSGAVATKTLSFNVGEGATGPCQLVGDFHVGFPVDQQGDEFSRLDVRGGVGSNAPGSIVGSFGPLKVAGQAVTVAEHRVINSFECKPELSFEFEIANDAEKDVDIAVAFTANYDNGFFVMVGDQC